MYKIIGFIIGTFLMLGLNSCAPSEDIQVNIKNIPAQRAVLEEIMGSKFTTIDSVRIETGKPFILKAPLQEERMYRLDFEKGKYIMLALEKGDKLVINADWQRLENYQVEGSPKSATVKKLVSGSKQSIIDIRTFELIFDSLNAQGQTEKLEQAQEDFKRNNQNFISFLKSFADTSTSAVASLMAVNLINPKLEAPFIADFYQNVQQRFPNNETIKVYAERFVGGQKLSAAPVNIKKGNPAPDFSGQTPNGETVRLQDYKGKYVLVDFWASWCGPCRAENPNVVKAYEQFKDKNFDIIGISLDTDKENWLKAIAKDKLSWEHISELKGWSNSVAQKYRVNSIPANFLVDPQGYIIAQGLRGKALQNKLAEVIK